MVARPRSARIAVGILTSSTVLAAAYSIIVAVRSAHPPRRLSAEGATAPSRAPATGRSSLPGPFAWLASTAAPTTWTDVLTFLSVSVRSPCPPGPRRRPRRSQTATLALLGSDGTISVTSTLHHAKAMSAWPAGSPSASPTSGVTAQSATQDGAVESVQSGQSLRSCVTDDYVSELGHRRFHEVACLVTTTSAGSVVVAATPSGDPAHLWTQLERAVAAYRLP